MPLAAMSPLNVVRSRFALYEFVLGDDGRIGAPLVGAVHCDVPLREAIHHLLQGRLVPPPTCPVEQLPRVPIEGFSDPELASFCPEIMPHLIELQDDDAPRGLWLLVVVCGQVPDPGEHGLRRHPKEKRDAVHGHPTQVPQNSVDLRGEGLAAWRRAGQLLTTLLTLLLGLTGSSALADDAGTLACGARMHQGSPPAGVAIQSARGIVQSSDGTPPLLG